MLDRAGSRQTGRQAGGCFSVCVPRHAGCDAPRRPRRLQAPRTPHPCARLSDTPAPPPAAFCRGGEEWGRRGSATGKEANGARRDQADRTSGEGEDGGGSISPLSADRMASTGSVCQATTASAPASRTTVRRRRRGPQRRWGGRRRRRSAGAESPEPVRMQVEPRGTAGLAATSSCRRTSTWRCSSCRRSSPSFWNDQRAQNHNDLDINPANTDFKVRADKRIMKSQ